MEKENYLEVFDLVVIGIYFVIVISVGLVVGNRLYFTVFRIVYATLRFVFSCLDSKHSILLFFMQLWVALIYISLVFVF